MPPPRIGPSTPPRPVTPPQMPIARPRDSGGKASLIMVSVSGRMSAADAPCAARAATSAPMLVASAAATEERANPARPIVKIRRRPNRSPRPEAVKSRQANASK